MENNQLKPINKDFFALTHEVVDKSGDEELRKKWIQRLFDADTTELVELTSQLTSDEDHRPANIKALREAIIIEIERKNTEKIVITMKKLDRAATLLTWASFLVAIVGAILAAIQVMQGYYK